MDLAVSLGLLLVTGGLGLLAYTYLGYPLLTALLPRRVPAAAPPERPRRSISVVVASRAAGSAVVEKAAWLLRHTDASTEVVVVLDGADPKAAAGLAALGTDRLRTAVLECAVGKAAALDLAVRLARGEILVFADVRPRIAPDAIPRLVAALDSPDVGAAAAAFVTQPNGRPNLLELYWRVERWIRRNEARFDSCIGASGCLYAVERAYWRAPAPGVLLDDVWVPMHVARAGKRVAYVEEARVTDVPFGSNDVEKARKVRTLSGNYQVLMYMPWLLHPGLNRLWFQFVSHKLLRLLTPAFSGAVVVGGSLLAVGTLSVAWLVGLLLGAVAAFGLAWWRGALLWEFGKTAVVMHAALLTALTNALKGRWHVWEDPPRPQFSDVAGDGAVRLAK